MWYRANIKLKKKFKPLKTLYKVKHKVMKHKKDNNNNRNKL